MNRQTAALGAFYFLVFAYIGVFIPWLPPLLERRGLDPVAIGLALALVQVARATLPPLWGLAADRLRRRVPLLAGAAVAAGAVMLGLGAAPGRGWIYVTLLLHGFFLVPLFPLAETLTMAALAGRLQRYGNVRLWGSVGFICSSMLLGTLLHRDGGALDAVPWLMAAPLLLAGLLAFSFREPASSPRTSSTAGSGRSGGLLPLALVIAAAGFGQGSHGPYYVFFTLQLEQRGVDAPLIGALWALGVAAEVALMAISGRLISRLGLVGACRLALGLGALRWLLQAAAPPLAIVAAAQLLHAASFGLLHVCTIRLVDLHSPAGRKALSQSVASAVAYGLSIGAASFLSGRLLPQVGYQGLYLGAAAASTLGWALMRLPVAASRQARAPRRLPAAAQARREAR